MAKREIVVVDGANVAYAETSSDGKPKVSNLVTMRRVFEQRGFTAIVIVDASLRHDVDDPAQLEALIDNQSVRQVPAGTDADYFVLETADQQQAFVISNDRYESRRAKYLWIDDRRVPFMIVRGEVQLYEDRLASAGPS